MKKPSPELALIWLFAPLVWIGLLVKVVNLVELRSTYTSLWREHQNMMQLFDQGQRNVRSATGDSLADMFEYMSTARGEYLDALEFVLLLGILPTMVIWFAVALKAGLSGNSKVVAVAAKDEA